MAKFGADDIYDALHDEQAFRALPLRLANALNARSAVILWRYPEGGGEVMAHSGYFTAAQMARYSEFAPFDPWANATATAQLNGQAQNLEAFISSADFERSVFFNEYLRPMGDDTTFCMGVRSDTQFGSGMVAIHRGKTQKSFSPAEVAMLGRYSNHLRRMLNLRGKLVAFEGLRAADNLLLAGMQDAAMIVDLRGRLIHLNGAAEALLETGDLLQVRSGFLVSRQPNVCNSLAAAIAAACSPEAAATSILLDGKKPSISASINPVNLLPAERHALLLISRPAQNSDSRKSQLERLFGLTRAESDVAVQVAQGWTVAEIAERRATADQTVRSQIKTIFAKTGCRNQVQLAGVVHALPIELS